MALPWTVVWITGASSGIGAEITKQLSEAGVKVAASARHLEGISSHPNVYHFAVDVTDADALKITATEIEERLGAIDLAIFAAGAYAPFKPESFDLESFIQINAVNYLGSVHALSAVLPQMMKRKSGHIAFVASVAGYMGLPKAAYYAPTKAALNNLAECLWMELRPKGIQVSVVNPGFVETKMTAANDFRMPFLMKPDRAATLTLNGLKSGKFEIAYPLRFVSILKALQILPIRLRLNLLSWMTS